MAGRMRWRGPEPGGSKASRCSAASGRAVPSSRPSPAGPTATSRFPEASTRGREPGGGAVVPAYWREYGAGEVA